jgi:peptide/nickel transport system permease protein
MITFLVRRVLGGVLVIFLVSVVTFLIFQIGPKITGADPAFLYTGKNTTPAAVAAVDRALGLDQPLPVQYGTWIKGILVGRSYTDGVDTVSCAAPCLGYSFRVQEPVTQMLLGALPVTISLALGAFVLWITGGLLIGVVSALRPGSVLDRGGMVFALVGVSLPVFFTGMLLQYTFSYGPAALRWFPDLHYVPFQENPEQWFANLVLPWITLALTYAALYARLSRANVREIMGEDYIRTARAKGLPGRTVTVKHALRAALTPIVTIAGLDLGALLGGAIVTESVFSYPGVGLLSLQAIQAQDLPVIMGVTILGSLFIVVANIVVDILYVVVDPRVRLS